MSRGGGGAPGLPVAPLQSPGSFPQRLRGDNLRVPAQTSPAAGCVAPRVPPCNVPCRGCLVSLHAGRGLGGWLPVGQLLPSRPPMCRAYGRGGGVCVPTSLRGVVEGAQGAGVEGSLCLGPSLCLARVGTKAGFIVVAQSMEGVVSILLRLVSVRCRPDAVRGVPLCTGAGLQACPGPCGSVRVTVWGRAAYGPSGVPPWVPRPSRGGGPPLARRGGPRADVPLDGLWRSVGWGGERGEKGGRLAGAPRPSHPVPPCLSLAAAGGGGLEDSARAPPTARGAAPGAPACFSVGRGRLASLGAGNGPGG